MPLSASRCSASSVREIRLVRLIVADWYVAGVNPVAE